MTTFTRVTDPSKIVTDPVLLSALAKQGVDKDYVEFYQDYASAYVGKMKVKGQSPCTKFYRDLKSNKRFMVASRLPMVDADGVKIESGWRIAGINYFSEKNNLFQAKVQGTQTEVIVRNDQPDGRKAGDKIAFNPQIFLNGVEQQPSDSTLLAVDPINPNYVENTLEWKYGFCKRWFRSIEGCLLGTWVLAASPPTDISIKYNSTGDFSLKLGYAVDSRGRPIPVEVVGDTEIIRASVLNDIRNHIVFPVIIGDSLTFNPDPHIEITSVDGRTWKDIYANTTWALIQGAATGDSAEDTSASAAAIFFGACGVCTAWRYLVRTFLLFDTSALPDDATISAAVLSVYGSAKGDGLSVLPKANIFSSLPASNVAIAVGDYDSCGNTAFATEVTYANWSTVGYTDFTFVAAGIAAISLIGVSKFSLRESVYDAPPTTPVWSANVSSWTIYFAEQGAGFKPKLVVTYTTPSAPTTRIKRGYNMSHYIVGGS